ncbi:3'(2'),5'-bisphosphate nucleotidase CysQ family protein [Leptospira sp. GIMC2001]|uniref:3'(2'),5'-bisphosphate nucleotidase CysQ family protein n=1 Tax=Leptospira sp. GIMC2001 TaxID=1513297 RepID=UPI002348F203|nr:inositol monophosphatase family protein [Leptospira sp. GIMC2001]WCL47896.1 hypothetical protein O4O04_11235 [Leptospira sp. GIMC2001]
MLEAEAETGFIGVYSAGLAIKKIYETDFEVKMKSADDPVTKADMDAHYAIHDAIQNSFPGNILLSEEVLPTWKDRQSAQRVWILDPLDGTRDFVERNPEFAVSLGLVDSKGLILGFVYNPVTGEFSYGDKFGRMVQMDILDANFQSAKLEFLDKLNLSLKSNERKESAKNLDQVIHNTELYQDLLEKEITIFVSRKELAEKLFDNLKLSSNFKIIGKGSIAYKLSLLSRSECDLVISLKPKNEWDICGGLAIIEANGFDYLEIKTKSKQVFNQEDTRSYGLIAGRSDLVKAFWNRYEKILIESLRDWN